MHIRKEKHLQLGRVHTCITIVAISVEDPQDARNRCPA